MISILVSIIDCTNGFFFYHRHHCCKLVHNFCILFFFSADVFVIYIGDQGSGTLMPRLLYSPQIAAVTEHFLLKEMEKDDRVMTCFRELTVDQREKISEQIN